MRKQLKTICLVMFIVMLTAAMATMMNSCGKGETKETEAPADTTATQVETQATETETEDAAEKSFTVVVVGKDGKETTFSYKSDKKTVGEVLAAEGLIEGTNSEYGLMVTKVNGESADYNVDGAYWAFYIGDTYAETGVDSTDIADGTTYKFVYTKA